MAVAGCLLWTALAAAQETAGTRPSVGDQTPASQAASAAPVPAIPPTTTQPPAVAAGTAASQPAEADLLAAESLRHSAMSMIYARWDARGRAGRLVALAAYAQKLDPANVQAAWIMSNIYQSRGQASAAEGALWRQLQADPNDFNLGLSYINVGLSARGKPDERQAFLQSIVENAALPDPLRAQAVVEQGRVFFENRDFSSAARLFNQALQLDGLNTEALQGVMATATTPPSLADSAQTLTKMIQASPRSPGLVGNLAAVLSAAGLHAQAAPLFDTMWEDAVAAAGPDAQPPVMMAGSYLQSLLDSGRAEKAVQIFDPLMEKYPADHGLMYLMIEAYRAVGRPDRADQLAQRIVSDLESQRAGTQPSTDAMMERAWLYTVYYPKPDLALADAQQAATGAGDDPTVQRILGAAELLSGQGEKVAAGLSRLEKLKATDAAAAALLAGHYFAAGDETAAKDAITATINVASNGWAYRYVRDLAAKRNITLLPHPQAQAVQQIFDQFDKRYLDMGRYPEKYLAVSLRPVADARRPGEGVQIEAVLTNTGGIPVPLGQQGLIQPVMNLEATAAPLTQERFTNLPMVVWPAPKYLPAGGSVSTVVRIDVGSLEYFLNRHPLDEASITATGMLDPVPQGRQTVSSVPRLRVAPLVIGRQSLVGKIDVDSSEQWGRAYPYALRVIMTDLVRGALPQRMLAARQLGELVTWVRDVQLFKAKMPEAMRGVINKGVLLAMVQKALQDPSDVVRAEMLAALQCAQMDSEILAVVLPAAKDASPLVRFRLVELLGATAARGQEKTIDAMSHDGDALVRQMASAFIATSSAGESGSPAGAGSEGGMTGGVNVMGGTSGAGGIMGSVGGMGVTGGTSFMGGTGLMGGTGTTGGTSGMGGTAE
jgi:tetratricopeptide (TPR) repeat protein